jgi:hypothetical protein
MNATELYACIGLPESALIGQRIAKRQIDEVGELASADRKLVSEQLETLIWQYALKPDNTGVKPYIDTQREYLEIAVIEGRVASRKVPARLMGRTVSDRVATRKQSARLAEIVHRVIPHPVLLVITDDEGLSLSVAHKRFGIVRKDDVIADLPIMAPWIETPGRRPIEDAFVASLALSKLPRGDMLDLYAAFASRLVALLCAELTGCFRIVDPVDALGVGRLDQLSQARAVQREVAQLRANLKNQPSFARQVELNNALRTADRRLAELLATL